jgi:transaldolase
MALKDLKIKIFADGAELPGMVHLYKEGLVKGFTTNPTLMKKAGITNYEQFAREALRAIPDLPISFEVFSDDLEGMEREARKIAGWGKNVNIKIPVTNSQGLSTVPVIKKLSAEGAQLNVTAVLTVTQVRAVTDALKDGVSSIISVFAGRIADTGLDPVPMMKECMGIVRAKPSIELLWASTRELLNIYQAEAIGCQIITVPHDILKKGARVGMDLTALSLDTVKMFKKDATAAGYTL